MRSTVSNAGTLVTPRKSRLPPRVHGSDVSASTPSAAPDRPDGKRDAGYRSPAPAILRPANASLAPSGDQLGRDAMRSRPVTSRAPRPSAVMTTIDVVSPFWVVAAMRRPSGDQAGSWTLVRPDVMRRAPEPSARITNTDQTPFRRLRANAIRDPLGDNAGLMSCGTPRVTACERRPSALARTMSQSLAVTCFEKT